jgi:hypothetical protein
VISEELSLVWYSLERVFQELQTKCEMIENSIKTLQEYKESVDRDIKLLKNNLNALLLIYGAVDAKRNFKEQSQQEV